MKTCSTRRGFTIVEVVMAISVVMIGVGALYDQFVKTSSRSAWYLYRAQAVMLAQQGVEELRAADFDSLKAYSAPATYEMNEDLPRFRSRAEVKPSGTGGMEITVTVGWGTNEGEEPEEFPAGQEYSVTGVRYQ